jgi:Zn-dependent peptidase ImmA (M78 family)
VDKWRLEHAAQAIRQQLRLGPTDILDLQQLADAIPAHVFFPEDLIAPGLADRARAIDWDGFAFVFPGEDCLMVLLNSGRSARRRSATLLEEFAHHLRGHKPTQLFRDPVTGLLRREYDKAQEQEAYDFGSMLLLPKELIQQHVKELRGTAEELADRCGCSVQLVEMRIKRCNLWPRHMANRN